MKLFLTVFIVFISGVISAAPDKKEVFPGYIIVKLKKESGYFKSSGNPTRTTLNSFGIELGESIWKPEFEAQRVAKRKDRNASPEADELAEGFTRTYKARLETALDPVFVAEKISNLPDVEYAEPVYIYKTQVAPDDALVGRQGHRYFNLLGFFNAFDVTRGSSDVIIAIVDSGVDYTHPDLDSKIWINTDEVPDNGIDDDGNGFIDDTRGWDFWESGATGSTLVQDNDPKGTGSDHGTHVAGTAAAETNNGVGIAGTGFNSRYMAVKVGGTTASPTSIGFGYEGMLYAINNGAHVINNSWAGSYQSFFGRDVAAYAYANNVVVISAASNENEDAAVYPAAYKDVVSVAAIGLSPSTSTSQNDLSKRKALYSNYHYTVDVSATGTYVVSTIFSNASSSTFGAGYGQKQGTSMASPVVAGLAGLLRAKYPNWSAQRIATQIRASATDISGDQSLSLQDALLFKMGNGMINAEKAVSTPLPGFLVSSFSMATEAGIKLRTGDSGVLRIAVKNAGEGATGTVSVSALVEGITISGGQQSVSLGNEQTQTIEFPIAVSSSYDVSVTPVIRVAFSVPNVYSDFNIIQISDFKFASHENNNVATSFAADGSMGVQSADDPATGIGFSVKNTANNQYSDNILFESGVMFSINGVMYNRVRGFDSATDDHFRPTTLHRVRTNGNGDQLGFGTFTFAGKAGAPPVVVTQETFSFWSGAIRNAIIARYTLRNNSTTTELQNVYAGVFSDWDIYDYSKNEVRFNAQDTVMFAGEFGNPSAPIVATVPYRKISSLLAIDNGYEGTQSPLTFGIYPKENDPNSGYTDQEKNWSLTAGLGKTSVSGTDISTVSASGPYNIPPGSSVAFAFIHAAGYTETEVLDAVRAAKSINLFELSTSSEERSTLPQKTGLVSAYPNPFNPSTNITFSLENAGQVRFELVNMLGQRVLEIGNRPFAAGTNTFSVNAGSLSSGVYLMVMRTGNTISTKRITLLK